MSPETSIVLFIFGTAIGSFVNVLALRYDGGWHAEGRSRCPHCGKTLRWFELVPLISFAIQRGKCRTCRERLSIQYPVVELLSGLVWFLVPLHFAGVPWPMAAFWILASELILLLAVIDIRLRVVPDELVVFLGVAALLETVFAGAYLGPAEQSFLGPFASVFGLYGELWLSHLAGAVIAGGFFGALVWVTPFVFKKEGMGMGDVTFAIPLGFLFGWPDILMVLAVAFIAGAAVGIALIIARRASRESALPFVPFLAAGAAYVFLFGGSTIEAYLRIIGL